MNRQIEEQVYCKGCSFTEKDGNTTYVIGMYFRKNEKNTLDDRVKGIIRNEIAMDKQSQTAAPC